MGALSESGFTGFKDFQDGTEFVIFLFCAILFINLADRSITSARLASSPIQPRDTGWMLSYQGKPCETFRNGER